MAPNPSYERPQEYVARHLRQAILDGTHRIGERLPVERELSEQFGVTRSAIRQALLILSHQGLIKVRSGAGGGPFVAGGSLPAAIAAFENLLVSDPVAIEEFVEAKLIIEPAITGYAAGTITAEYVELLRENVAEHRDTIRRREDCTAIALAFHSLIVESSGSRYLSVIVELIGQTLERLPDPPGTSPVAQERILRDHEQLVDALEQRDAEQVRQLAAVHLQHIWRRDAGADDVPGPPITTGDRRPC